MWQSLSRQYASQLRLEIKPSKTYQAIVWVLSSIVFLSIIIVDIDSFFLKSLIAIVYVLYVLYALSNNRERTLHWQADSYWLIDQQHQLLDDAFHIRPQIRAELLGGSVVTTFISVLNFKSTGGRKFNVVIFRDSLNSSDFRKLRLKLKLEGTGLSSHDTI